MPGSSRYGSGLGSRDAAYDVAHAHKQFRKQHAQHDVILHHQNAEWFYGATSLAEPPLLTDVALRVGTASTTWNADRLAGAGCVARLRLR